MNESAIGVRTHLRSSPFILIFVKKQKDICIMISQPFFSGLSAKFYDFSLIALVTLMYIGLCAEADMYVPAFPQMIQYFGVAENKIQLILSLNFGGLCIAGLVTGPLSDSFGRRPVLLVGLGLFVLSSLGCVYSASF